MKAFSINDRVAYSAGFCRSIGALTGSIPAGRGRIVELKTLGSLVLAVIEWNDSTLPTTVNVANLAHVGPNRRFAHCE